MSAPFIKRVTGTTTRSDLNIDDQDYMTSTTAPRSTLYPSHHLDTLSNSKPVAVAASNPLAHPTELPTGRNVGRYECPLPPVPAMISTKSPPPSAYPRSLRTTHSSRSQGPSYQSGVEASHSRTKSTSSSFSTKVNTRYTTLSAALHSLVSPLGHLWTQSKATPTVDAQPKPRPHAPQPPPRPPPPEPWKRIYTPTLEHYIERGQVVEFPPGSQQYRLAPPPPIHTEPLRYAHKPTKPAPAMLTRPATRNIPSQLAGQGAGRHRSVSHGTVGDRSTKSSRTISTLSDRASIPKRDSVAVYVNVDGKYAWPRWI